MIETKCVCGGVLQATSKAWFLDAVVAHNMTPEHRAWRSRCRPSDVDNPYESRLAIHTPEGAPFSTRDEQDEEVAVAV